MEQDMGQEVAEACDGSSLLWIYKASPILLFRTCLLDEHNSIKTKTLSLKYTLFHNDYPPLAGWKYHGRQSIQSQSSDHLRHQRAADSEQD